MQLVRVVEAEHAERRAVDEVGQGFAFGQKHEDEDGVEAEAGDPRQAEGDQLQLRLGDDGPQVVAGGDQPELRVGGILLVDDGPGLDVEEPQRLRREGDDQDDQPAEQLHELEPQELPAEQHRLIALSHFVRPTGILICEGLRTSGAAQVLAAKL
eukprot:scaffold23927_cov41-Prasinocladus_malaysianus.AAC.2